MILNLTRKMPNGIMGRFFSTVLEQATYSGRNKGIFVKKSRWSHFLKKTKKNTCPLSKTVSICFQPSFGSICHHSGANGHYGIHPGFQNRKIFAILNLHLAQMPQVSVQSDLRFGRWCGLKILQLLPQKCSLLVSSYTRAVPKLMSM